jgi:hypothetical protein
MKFAELIDCCIRMINAFNPKNAVGSYVEEFLKGVTNPHESVFITQIFYGVIRYKSFLKVLIKAFN